jgi:Domain of unknown function (DUF1905)/Bacteriocin-protection, YdeI or OmpD-Associated
MMKFRSHVEPPEPMRGLEVPPEAVEALGGGKRPPVTITVNGHSWKSRVAIMRGRYLLGLSNANRKAAGVVTGDEVEVEVEVELDAEPRVVAEPADFARALAADPAARTAYDHLSYGHQREHVRAIESRRSRRRAHEGSRRPWLCCGIRSRQGAVRPAPRLEAITPDVFDRTTPGRQPACGVHRPSDKHPVAPKWRFGAALSDERDHRHGSKYSALWKDGQERRSDLV